IFGARVVPQQKMKNRRPRKFRSAAKPSELRIEGAPEDEEAAIQHALVDRTRMARCNHGMPLKLRHHVARRIYDLVAPFPPCGRDLREDRHKPGMPVAIFRRKICAAEEGL